MYENMLLGSGFCHLFVCACAAPTSMVDASERVTLHAIIGAYTFLLCCLVSTLFVALSRDAEIFA